MNASAKAAHIYITAACRKYNSLLSHEQHSYNHTHTHTHTRTKMAKSSWLHQKFRNSEVGEARPHHRRRRAGLLAERVELPRGQGHDGGLMAAQALLAGAARQGRRARADGLLVRRLHRINGGGARRLPPARRLSPVAGSCLPSRCFLCFCCNLEEEASNASILLLCNATD